MSFLIDTDICSSHFKNANSVRNRFLQYMGRLNLSTITVGELFTWAYRAKASPRLYLALTELFNDITILPVTPEVAEVFGKIRAKLMDIGKPAPVMDLMIAATAITHDLILVTHNVKDYANIPDLQVVDWLVS